MRREMFCLRSPDEPEPFLEQSSVGLAGGYDFILQGKALPGSNSLSACWELEMEAGDQMNGMDLVINLL